VSGPLPVIYEDSEIIVIDKPAGLAVQGGAGIKRSVDTVLAAQTGGKVYPVHRLDKDTSGVLIVARSAEAAAKWTQLIGSDKIRKEYIALCIGSPPDQGTLSAAVTQKGESRDARTGYTVIERFPEAALALVRFRLYTGRTHQIRIQAAGARFPIAADDKYGDFAKNRELARTRGIKKLQRHSARTVVTTEGRPHPLEAPLPPPMEATLALLNSAKQCPAPVDMFSVL
jgi:23S rRNA pseudouridine955/2504/2580 synthase